MSSTMKELGILNPEAQEIVGQVEETLQTWQRPAAVYYTAARTIFDDYFDGTYADLPALEQAIMYAKQARDLIPPCDPDLGQCLDSLATMLRERYQLSGAPSDLEEAINIQRSSVDAAAKTHPIEDGYYGDFCGNLAQLLLSLYERDGGMEILDELLQLYQTALDKGMPNAKAIHWNGLALAYHERYHKTLKSSDLEAAYEAIQNAKTLDPKPCGFWLTAAQICNSRFERTNEDKFLDETVEQAKMAHELLRTQSPSAELYAKITNYLASTLSTRYARSGRFEDLKASINLARNVLKVTPESYPQYIRRCQVLCSALHQLFERTNSLEVLEESVSLAEKAIRTQSFQISLQDQSMHYHNLAIGLHLLFSAKRDPETIQRALNYATKAISLPQRPTSGALLLINLSLIYQTRYSAFGALSDLHEAIRIMSEAVDSAPPNQLAWAMNGLAGMFENKFRREGDPAVLTMAVAKQSEALQRTPDDHPLKFKFIKDAGDLVVLQHLTAPNEDVLRQAIATGTAHLEKGVRSDDHRGVMLAALSELNTLLYQSTRNTSTLELAISQIEQAVQLLHEGSYSGTSRYLHLGNLLFHRCKRTGNGNSLQTVIQAFKNGLYHRASPPTDRYRSGRMAGYVLATEQRWEEASEVLQAAIQLLPRINPRELEWDDQQHHLRDLSNVSSLAASVVLEARAEAADALTLLETGRCLMARIATDLRSDLQDLERINLNLATKYSDLRNQLKNLRPGLKIFSDSRPKSWVHAPDTDPVSRRLEIVKQLDDLETKIRQEVPGFADFLLPKRADAFPRLVKSTSHAIVAFNTTSFRSDAFLITMKGVTYLPLPTFRWYDVTAAAEMLVGPNQVTDGSMDTFHERNKQLRGALQLLWSAAVKPVLEKLGFLISGNPSRLPRVTWVTSGVAGLLPFHAAGSSWQNGRENTASHVVSSYAPSFQALEVLQRKSNRLRNEGPEKFLLVAMPKTTGCRPLSVNTEVECIQNLLATTHIGVSQHLDMPSKESVLEHLHDASVAYFGCHANSDAVDPSNGGLYLADGPDGKPTKLTVRDLASMSLPRARLAYLAACSTADNPSPHLRDEVINLAGILQVIGFPHVIGTMWSADNGAANRITRLFFERILGQDLAQKSGDRDYALALHEATKIVREEGAGGGRRKKNASDNVTVWAPFIHMGW